MTCAASTNAVNFWQFDALTPQPRQDADLLKQLGFVPGLKEILMLRQVHALEHGTVWILSETESAARASTPFHLRQDNETLGGLSTDRGFYLYGQVSRWQLERAAYLALQRFRAGEWDLAVHPRCGTNVSVAMLLTAGLAIGSHVLLPRLPLTQLLGLGIAVTTATQLAPDVGQLAQKYLTTAIPFNLELTQVQKTTDFWGRSAHFVGVSWQELQ